MEALSNKDIQAVSGGNPLGIFNIIGAGTAAAAVVDAAKSFIDGFEQAFEQRQQQGA